MLQGAAMYLMIAYSVPRSGAHPAWGFEAQNEAIRRFAETEGRRIASSLAEQR